MEPYKDERPGATEFDQELIKHGIKRAPATRTVARRAESLESALGIVFTAGSIEDDSPPVREEKAPFGSVGAPFSAEEYRARRLAELQAEQADAARNRFGRPVHISADTYVTEVTESSRDKTVVLLLVDPAATESALLQRLLGDLAETYPFTKVCVGNVFENVKEVRKDDRNLPLLLVYKNRKIARSFGGIAAFGNKETLTAERVAEVLSKHKLVVWAKTYQELKNNTFEQIYQKNESFIRR